MSRISEIRIKQTPACYTVSVRKTIDFKKEYVSFFDESLALIDACLDRHAVLTSSPPLTYFHNMELAQLDVEIGYHIAQEMPGEGEISCQDCPPRKVISAIDMGPYEDQDSTLMDLFEYIKQNGLEMQGPICYYYLNEPNRPESQYLTQMLIPVK